MSAKPRILFVDDEKLLLDGIIRSTLRSNKNDWIIQSTASPFEAIEMQKENAFDVVVTDYSMPQLNGIQLAQKIHEIDATTQIIMLTGTADLEVVTQVINTTEIFRFCTKPCDNEELQSCILDSLEKKTEVSSKTQSSDMYHKAALDRLSVGVIICDRSGKISSINKYGQEICNKADSVVIDRDNILRAVQASHRDKITEILKVPLAEETAISLDKEHSDTTLTIIASGFEDTNDLCLLLSDPDMHIAPSVETLQSLYSLPPSEARLLHHLVNGQNLKDAADKVGLTDSSARTYLKRIFMKTNTNSQLSLIRTVLLTPQLQTSA
ncbi:DNA-binding response regulator [Curvivirga sp.]|uniref:DNA-binding response regulator n=1 Tax=Curvivirga sp. TaxID=2856848 RepID=UPI003B5BBD6C